MPLVAAASRIVVKVGSSLVTDEGRIRALTVARGIPCITTLSGAAAAVRGIEARRKGGLEVRALQDYFPAK